MLPRLIENERFRKKLLGLDEGHDPRIETLARFGEWFFRFCINNERSKGTTLLLCGGTGTGKSHVAKAVHSQISAWAVGASFGAGWKGRFPFTQWIDWPFLVESDRATIFDERLADIRDAQVVFIDDVGSESDKFKNGEGASRLRRVLSDCENKWLLITSNFSKAAFSSRYDARISDRLSAAHWCDLSGVPSYRPKLKT